MKTAALALLMATLTLPVAATQEPDAAAAQTEIVADYVERIENDDMSLMVVHLNDLTTDAFFSAPTKYALRAQARQNLMFFVQALAKRDLAVNTSYEVRQVDPQSGNASSFRTVPVNILNFENGTRVSAGEGFQGIISTASAINLRVPFAVRFGNITVEFMLSGEAVDRLEQ